MLVHVFPAPPLKFRTAGFPQYGFKREVDADLREKKNIYTTPKSARPTPVAPKGMSVGIGPVDALVQRPLAHHPVMLSGWINAYYGLIRATRLQLGTLFSSSAKSPGGERVPTFVCASFQSCHLQYPGGPNRCLWLFLPCSF